LAIQANATAIRANGEAIRANREMIGSVRTEIKADMASLQAEVKSDMASLRDEVKSDMASLRDEVKANMASLRNEMKTDMASFSNEMKSTMDSLRKEIMGFLLWGFGLLFTVMLILVGFILWERRSTIKPFKDEIEDLKERKIDRIIAALKKLSEEDARFALALRSVGLL